MALNGVKVYVAVDEESKPIALSPRMIRRSSTNYMIRLIVKGCMLTQHMMLMKLKADCVEANIPVNSRNGGKMVPYDVDGYWLMRSAVERFNAWLKTFRMAIIRYERLAIMFKAIFTCIMIYRDMDYEKLNILK